MKEIKYSKEFRHEALKLSDEIGVTKAASQLGIKYYTLSEWRRNRKAEIETAKPTLTDDELQLRTSEFERENDILKDALGFFAKDRKK